MQCRCVRAQDAVLVLSAGPTVTTLAGTGHSGSDAATLATAAPLASPGAVAYSVAGDLYVCDTQNHRVLRILSSGSVATVAGNGIQGFSGDNGPATAASFDSPSGITIAPDGTLYIADTRNHRVRRVKADGTVQTVAGSGAAGFGGDQGLAVDAQLRNPTGLALGALGELYIADTGNHRVRRVALDGTTTTVAGNGAEEATGDGGAATSAGLDAPSGLAYRSSDGVLFIADRLNSRIRLLSADGRISSLTAAAAPVRRAAGLAVDGTGNLLIADTGHFQLRGVTSKGAGLLLGSGEQGTVVSAAGYAATPLGTSRAVTADATGGVAFTDRDRSQVQHLALPQLAFADTAVGQVSPSQGVTLRNAGETPLSVSGIDLPSAFQLAVPQGCGAIPFQIAAGQQCTIALAFSPTVVGSQGALLTVETSGLPQRMLLTGTGLTSGSLLASRTLLTSAGTLAYAGSPVTFTARVLGSGTAVATGNVHLQDAGSPLATSALGADGSAAFTTAALPAGQHSLSVAYDGDLHYAASTSAALQQIVVLAPDFTLTAAATQMAVTAGSTATMEFVLQPVNGVLNQPVTLAFSGLPTGATAVSNAPTPLVLGSNAVTVRYTVTTPAPAAVAVHALLIGPLLTLLSGVFSSRFRSVLKRSGMVNTVGVGLVALLVLGSCAGCGGGFLSGAAVTAQSASHTYPVTITATATGVTGSTLVHTASVTLVVQ